MANKTRDRRAFLLARLLHRSFRQQRGLADDVLQLPPLQLRQWTRFLDPHNVTDVSLIALVMRVELLIPRDHAPVKRMRLLPRHLHHDRLVHLVRDDLAHHFLAAALRLLCRFRHYFFSVAAARVRSPRIVFTRAMSLRNPRIFFRLSVCPMFIWNFSLNNWSARSFS